MDSIALSDAMIHDLATPIAQQLRAAIPTTTCPDLATLEHTLQALGRRVLGAALTQVVTQVVAEQAATLPRPTTCAHCGGRLRLVHGARPRHLRGLVGDLTFRRPTFVCRACHRGSVKSYHRLSTGRSQGEMRSTS